MGAQLEPVVDTWYEDLDSGRQFEVTDFDAGNGVVEVRYSDGEVEELGLDSWYELALEPIEEPEDWLDEEEEDDDEDEDFEEDEEEDDFEDEEEDYDEEEDEFDEDDLDEDELDEDEDDEDEVEDDD